MRSTILRARQLVNAEHNPAYYHPGKAYEKRFDKNNKAYYILRKRLLANSDPGKQHHFFEMPDLLLDLDAEGSRNVRPFDDADEQAMASQWTKASRQIQVKARIRDMQEQVAESRRKVHEILNNPSNIWRITPHDVVSAALYGGAPTQKVPAMESFLCETPESVKPSLYASKHYQTTDIVRAENGIPQYAVDEDRLLLRWMMLHHQNAAQSSTKCAVPTESQFSEALSAQTSITGVRRLVLQCLAAGMSTANFHVGTRLQASSSDHIRNALERVVKSAPSKTSVRIDVLSFLGNLSERLSSLGSCLGSVLCGMALRLSAEVASLEATSAWIHHCHYKSNGERPASRDLLATLDLLLALWSGKHTISLPQNDENCRMILQMLTGLDHRSQLSPHSFRSFLASDDEQGGAIASYEVFARYIQLLGQLGAARTIWAEWHEMPIHWRKNDAIAVEHGTALIQAISVMAAVNDEFAKETRLADCVMGDYDAIGMQDMRACQIPALQDGLDAAACRSALDLPFRQCASAMKNETSEYMTE